MPATSQPKPGIPLGWKGGFAQSEPAFAYPDPNLSSLPMLDNMANIDRLQRQQKVLWPEFSWLSEPDETDPVTRDDSRCFQMFAPDISRLGYTDEGRVYSIICPQQGVCTELLGCLNVEVTVTGQRGWADETDREMAADMTVEGKIWFTPGAMDKLAVRALKKVFDLVHQPFPLSKAQAILVTTSAPGDPGQPIFPVRKGEARSFTSPDFARHADVAWAIANIEVEIGPIIRTGHEVVDDFNQMVMDIFNFASGNMLLKGNILSWNVWFNQPDLVDRTEWREHAEYWRKSIDADHGSPDGQGTSARYFNGEPFKPFEGWLKEEQHRIDEFLKKHMKLM